jgi:hypothetical protein
MSLRSFWSAFWLHNGAFTTPMCRLGEAKMPLLRHPGMPLAFFARLLRQPRYLPLSHERPTLTRKFLGNLVIPYGERRRRGTGAPLCYPASWPRVVVSVCAVVLCARLGVWIGEVAASSLVTTRPVAPGWRRSRWEDCLYPPLPRPLPVCPWAAAASLQPLPLPPGGCWGSWPLSPVSLPYSGGCHAPTQVPLVTTRPGY